MSGPLANRFHPAGRCCRPDRRRRQGICRRGGARSQSRAGSVVVERPRQAQYRTVRRRASPGAGGDRLEPWHRPRQGADRSTLQSRHQRQRHHGVAAAACGDHGRDRRRPLRSDGDRTRAVAGGRGAAQARRRAADLCDDLPVLDPQLSTAVLDGGRRCRSRRGCAHGGAAAAVHGRQSRKRAGRWLLRRCALEFHRGRSRRRPHPAFRLRHSGARGGEGAGGAPELVGAKSGCRCSTGARDSARARRSSKRTARRPRASWRGPIASASTPISSGAPSTDT